MLSHWEHKNELTYTPYNTWRRLKKTKFHDIFYFLTLDNNKGSTVDDLCATEACVSFGEYNNTTLVPNVSTRKQVWFKSHRPSKRAETKVWISKVLIPFPCYRWWCKDFELYETFLHCGNSKTVPPYFHGWVVTLAKM